MYHNIVGTQKRINWNPTTLNLEIYVFTYTRQAFSLDTKHNNGA